MPLAVVSAGKDVLPGGAKLQDELAGLSRNSIHSVVKDADHVTLITHREYAMTVVDAIRHVAEQARAGRAGGR